MRPSVITAVILIALYLVSGCVAGGWYTRDLP